MLPDINNRTYQSLWDAPEIRERIDSGIEANRKSGVSIHVTDAQGKPIEGASIRSVQKTSDFHFGANIFMLGGYGSAEQNARYEEAYLGLFNGATVPFYWRGLQLEEGGKPRYDADSVFVARRPAPDNVIPFCEQHGLRMHGHTLVWDFYKWSVPDWLPDDPAAAESNAELTRVRMFEIGKRYGHRIKSWDVLNEAFCTPDRVAAGTSCAMPEGYERLAFEWAAEAFPEGTRFDINDVSGIWFEGLERYGEMVEQLLAAKTRLGCVGMQFHLGSNNSMTQIVEGKHARPEQLLHALDRMGRFGLPLHVSEITLASLDNSIEGQEIQATVARNFYRLWFSHSAVNGITWWNVPDGGAAPGEDHMMSGLLTEDLTPKRSYKVLRDLIHKEWRTRHSGCTDARGELSFRGFHGTYEVRVEHGGKTVMQEVSVTRGAESCIQIRIG